jgi:hypothetical protein
MLLHAPFVERRRALIASTRGYDETDTRRKDTRLPLSGSLVLNSIARWSHAECLTSPNDERAEGNVLHPVIVPTMPLAFVWCT